MKKYREIWTPTAPTCRETEQGRFVEGYAIVFGQKSEILYDFAQQYREIIEPEAISQEELAAYDVIATMWHNREKLLARSRNGEGTLTMSVDAKGLQVRFLLPNTEDGNNAYSLVTRGDIQGMSFTYWADEAKSVNYTRDEDGTIIRHVNHIDGLFDVTLATSPAYPQTEVSVTNRETPAGMMDLIGRESETGKSNDAGRLKYNKAKFLINKIGL